MRKADSQPETVHVVDRREWRAWLEQNHATSSGIWLIVNKKNSSQKGVSLDDAVEEALCFGWIDGGLRRLDDERFRLFMSPRRPKSVWSKLNKQRIERLIASGQIAEAGLRVIVAAKLDGSWNQLDAIDALEIPDDLRSALAADKTAESNFMAFSDSSRKMILWWIISAKRAETRERRISKVVAQAAQNIKANHYRQ
jgi:uncharacterized protein YdeI (YjbR/CyaY-like superfamily)